MLTGGISYLPQYDTDRAGVNVWWVVLRPVTTAQFERILDVGCDHALLSCHLLTSGSALLTGSVVYDGIYVKASCETVGNLHGPFVWKVP